MHTLYAIGDQLGIAIQQAMLYDRLRKARERMRRLARYNLVAEEEERRRIARELHDETSQSLSGIALQLQALIEMAARTGYSDEQFAEGLKKVQTLTVQVHNEVSRLISNLRPALLDTVGLLPAVRQHAESRCQAVGCTASVDVVGKAERFPADIEAALFRFVQGAVGNVCQHAQAKQVAITLDFRPGEFFVTVRDDGVGFDVSEITDVEESGRGRGLFSMRERIGFLGGTSGIESQPGKGTTVWARVPVGQDIHYVKDKGADS